MMKRENGKDVSSGTARNATKAQQILSRRAARGNGEKADWGSVDSGKLRTAVASITRCGYGVILGYTRDEGAYTILVVGLENAKPEYVRPTEDIDLFLEALAIDFE